MANFPPLKNYILYCIDKLVTQYDLGSAPRQFLDVGCGMGDIGQYFAGRDWQGKLIDISGIAVEKARENLKIFKNIEVENKSLFQETGVFRIIFLLDVLEHIENDRAALDKVFSLLAKDGHAVISVPSNPREWRWDDDFYGHYRRYTAEEINNKLIAAGLEPLIIWDFTYPVFWLMRRLYTRLKSHPQYNEEDKSIRSALSSLVNAWNIPFYSNLFLRNNIFWNFINDIQFTYFRDKIEKGHEMIILAKKKK